MDLSSSATAHTAVSCPQHQLMLEVGGVALSLKFEEAILLDFGLLKFTPWNPEMGETQAGICSASQHSSLVGLLAPFSAPLSPRQCRPLSLGSEKTPLDTVQQDQEEKRHFEKKNPV